MIRKTMPTEMKSKRGASPQRGDTILSVMISVVIIGSVISATYYAINRSLSLGRASYERSHASNVASIQLERLKALMDKDPDVIFEDASGINWHKSNTPPQLGFGHKFCLMLDEANSGPGTLIFDPGLATIPKKHAVDPANEVHDDCKNPDRIHFPSPDAQPRVEIRYQAKHTDQVNKASDNNRFEIAVYWTRIGSDETEELKIYWRSHPLIFGL